MIAAPPARQPSIVQVWTEKEIAMTQAVHVVGVGMIPFTKPGAGEAYELMVAQAAQGAITGVELVVVTGSGMQAGGVATAASPQEALELLERKGYETALVGGGAALDASFLSHGLVDEIRLNVESILSSDGLPLDFDSGPATDLRLIDTRKLSESVVQLRYEVRR